MSFGANKNTGRVARISGLSIQMQIGLSFGARARCDDDDDDDDIVLRILQDVHALNLANDDAGGIFFLLHPTTRGKTYSKLLFFAMIS